MQPSNEIYKLFESTLWQYNYIANKLTFEFELNDDFTIVSKLNDFNEVKLNYIPINENNNILLLKSSNVITDDNNLIVTIESNTDTIWILKYIIVAEVTDYIYNNYNKKLHIDSEIEPSSNLLYDIISSCDGYYCISNLLKDIEIVIGSNPYKRIIDDYCNTPSEFQFDLFNRLTKLFLLVHLIEHKPLFENDGIPYAIKTTEHNRLPRQPIDFSQLQL